jgi:hypothetical protein
MPKWSSTIRALSHDELIDVMMDHPIFRDVELLVSELGIFVS